MWRPLLRLLLLVFILNASANLSGKTNATTLEKVSRIQINVCFKKTVTIVISKTLLVKSSENNFVFSQAFYLTLCVSCPKNFEKIAILKI